PHPPDPRAPRPYRPSDPGGPNLRGRLQDQGVLAAGRSAPGARGPGPAGPACLPARPRASRNREADGVPVRPAGRSAPPAPGPGQALVKAGRPPHLSVIENSTPNPEKPGLPLGTPGDCRR